MSDAAQDDSGIPDLPEPSTALARRTPTALAKAPSFYPTGHADQSVLFKVTVGGPFGVAMALGGTAALLGGGPVAAVAMGIVGAPIGLFGTNWYYEDRGKRQLKDAQLLFSHSPEAGRRALAAIVGSRAWLPEVRLEAAGRLAIDAVERGEIAEAIQILDVGEQDAHLMRRRRSWEVGARAEVMRSILAWLSPDAFTDYGVADSTAFTDPEDDEAVGLLASLRLLEVASRDDDASLAAAWEDVTGTQLRAVLPTLYTVIAAVAAERLHHLSDALHERLRADPDGRLRTLLRRLFPRMQVLIDDGYRGVSQDLPAESDHTSLEIVAPTGLAELARLPEGMNLPATRGGAATAFGFTYGMFVLMGVAMAAGGLGGLAVVFAVFMALYIGTPIAAIWGGNLTEARERARRVAPLRLLTPPPANAWLVECASGPPGPITRTSGYRKLSDIPPSQMVLYVAVIRAEQALARGDVEAAYEEVAWWFTGFAGQLPSRDPMFAVGSSLIRIATLSGHVAQADRLSRVVPEVGNPWDDSRRRTAYGNSSRALALARGLLAATQGQWDLAAGLVEAATTSRPVYMDRHDAALYAELVRRVESHGHEVRWNRWKVDPSWAGWVRKVWPE